MGYQQVLKFYRGKRVLLTGHTGFKGSWLSQILINAGADVTGYALEPPTDPSFFEILGLKGKMRSIAGDIRDFEHLNQVFNEVKPEIVFHLAAQPIVRTSYKEPRLTYETNVMGTVNVCEAIRLHTDFVRSFLNVTTDKVYKNNEWVRGYRENEPLDGYDPYSNSKSCSELVTHSYIRSFFGSNEADALVDASTARAGNVIGGGDFAADRIIPDCVRALQTDTPIIIRNPHSIRPYQHVLEPIFMYLTIAAEQYDDHSKAGFYNVGPEECDCITTGELVKLFSKYCGQGFKAEIAESNPNAPHEANFLKLDTSLIKQTFGYRPTWHIEEAVEKTVEWSKEWLQNPDEKYMTGVVDRQIQEFLQGNE